MFCIKKLFFKPSKIIVIAGPTSTGKSDIAVDIALNCKGEIISADSRQVYRGLDIGSGKISKEEMRGVPHHMLDVASPMERFSVKLFQEQAQLCIEDILKRNKIPIICGGSSWYIDALIYQQQIPKVPPNKELREELSFLSTEELYEQLCRLDPRRAQEIDKHNKVRLVRALEIIESVGVVPKTIEKKKRYNLLYIGLSLEKELHYRKIYERIIKRSEQGMVEEVKQLHQDGASWVWLESLGLEYRYLSKYLQNKINREEMIEVLYTQTKKFVKRQYSWLRKNKDIVWCNTLSERAKIFKLVEKFLK